MRIDTQGLEFRVLGDAIRRAAATFKILIYASSAAGNAPTGYLLARIEIIAGQLFAECERNPHTNGEWRWLILFLGDMRGPSSASMRLCVIDMNQLRAMSVGSACSGVVELLDTVSMLYEDAIEQGVIPP